MDTDRPQDTGAAPGAQRLMPIGIFSRMTGLSHRALRLYADRGLLLPAHVDEATGYRYYDVHSIRAAEMIRLLRRLGVPLGEMRLYIDAAATDRLEETLTQQKQRLEQEQARLDAALKLLGRIDELDGMFRAAPAVELVELAPGALPALDGHDGAHRVPRVLHRARRDAGGPRREPRPSAGGSRGGRPTRPDRPGPRRRRRDRPGLRVVPAGGRGGRRALRRRRLAGAGGDLVELEGGLFARSVFTGLYEDGYRFAYARQLEWLADSGRKLRGLLRMRFIRDERDTADPADFATELLWPATEPLPADAEERPPDLTHGWLRP